MKTCKDFDINLCTFCRKGFHATCNIIYYRGLFLKIGHSKQDMVGLLFSTGFSAVYDLNLKLIVLEEYFPELYDWYQKIKSLT